MPGAASERRRGGGGAFSGRRGDQPFVASRGEAESRRAEQSGVRFDAEQSGGVRVRAAGGEPHSSGGPRAPLLGALSSRRRIVLSGNQAES